MQHRSFGTTGSTLPTIGQGTWYLERAADAIDSLRAGMDLGMTHIDTAEMYGAGAAEEITGRAIADRRDEVFVVSKVLPSNASRRGTLAACERSLRHLGTDRLDLYLLHWPGTHPLAETFSAMETLIDSGKIRACGVSNFDVDDLMELEREVGTDRIACNQVYYSALERTAENDVLPWCRERGIPLVAYSPFGHNKLPGPDIDIASSLYEVAAQHEVSAYQVALAFVTRHKDVFTIPKAASLGHVTDNAQAGDLVLTDDQIALLEARLPRAEAGSYLPIL